jgi:hypothetical protein
MLNIQAWCAVARASRCLRRGMSKSGVRQLDSEVGREGKGSINFDIVEKLTGMPKDKMLR